MPTYEYFCPENGRSVEVLHGMSTTLTTWGDLCQRAEHEPGDTPADTPVQKLLGTGTVLSNSRSEMNDCLGPPPAGGCCGGGCAMPG